ncbi:MAG: gliding motility-associated C-terminal domain-containing protein [Bacteroidales bacterium]|nr:gliding motility-associated C-terminal domain-containing protein [Bacteroidales bacterium]
MKKFTNDQFDDFIRNQLYDYEQEPPIEVFQSLKKNIQKNNIFHFNQYIALGIITIATFIATYFFLNHNDTSITTHNLNDKTTIVQPASNNIMEYPITTEEHKQNIIHNNSNTRQQNLQQKATTTNSITTESTQADQMNQLIQTDNKNNLKTKPVYEVVTHAATCKQWNGKAYIRCNTSDISFYWKELNVHKTSVENLKYGQYTVFAKRGDEIIDTIIINIPDSGSVIADFKIYDLLIGNELMTITENLTLIDKKIWKNQNNVSFYWYFDNEAVYAQAEPKHSFTKSGQYTISLVAKSSKGCIDSITKSYIVEIPLNYVELPNIFSPNGDGIHDYFTPVLYDMESVECSIFDRNGTLIYEWKTLDGKWDGKIRNTNQTASPGTYYYILKGKTKSGKQIMHKGMVQLVL